MNLKKIFALLSVVSLAMVGCAEHDPILSGTRIDIFENSDVKIENKDVPQLSGQEKNISGDEKCDYRQDTANNIWRGDKKIFSGFATGNIVKSNQSPICMDGFLYTGLSTGEVIKISTLTKDVIWVADVFRDSNMTGGASVVDIVAHVGVIGDYVYAGGLGDAFCKLSKHSGKKYWCVNISVPVDFIMVDGFAFVVGADSNLYAINLKNGKVYWKTEIKTQIKPIYQNGVLTVGNQRINYKNGKVVK